MNQPCAILHAPISVEESGLRVWGLASGEAVGNVALLLE